MAAIIIYNFFHQLQFVLKLTLLVCFFILEATSQNARLAEVEEFPYVVTVFSSYQKVGLRSLCTGVLLSLNHILIRNDCFFDQHTGELRIRGGSVFGWEGPGPGEFTLQNKTFHINDVKKLVCPVGNIAIIELPNEFNEGRAVMSISIAKEIRPNPNEPGYYIVGYPFSYPLRDNSFNDPNAILMKTNINVNNRTYCGEYLPIDTELELCTGVITGGIGACNTFGAILIRKASTPQGNDELYGILNNACCGAPRCLDTFYDLANPTIKKWAEEIIDTSCSESPSTVETTTEYISEVDSQQGK